jgi:transposase
MTSTRCGISAKQLEREIGVHYETAHRMTKKIRTELMKDDGAQLCGDVEIDETSIGGRPRKPHGIVNKLAIGPSRKGQRPPWAKDNPTVLGMVERGGRIRFRVIASRHGAVLSNAVITNVNPFLDHLCGRLGLLWAASPPLHRPPGRQPLGRRIRARQPLHEHDRGRVREHEDRDAGRLQEGLPHYLQSYCDEYAWRTNAKLNDELLFEQLLDRAARAS